jgi:hypothetical protein
VNRKEPLTDILTHCRLFAVNCLLFAVASRYSLDSSHRQTTTKHEHKIRQVDPQDGDRV